MLSLVKLVASCVGAVQSVGDLSNSVKVIVKALLRLSLDLKWQWKLSKFCLTYVDVECY